MKNTYDFYTRQEKIHFAREIMTAQEALAYARKFDLDFNKVK